MSKLESAEEIAEVVTKVSEIVSKLAGIQLGAKQASMVRSRLSGRMLKLKINSFQGYLRFLNAHLMDESQALLSLLTTHHTFFFREFAHFEFILNHGLSRAIARARERGDKKIRIWSAASSRGQEAYSLAMFMRFHLTAMAPDVDFEIWGTDVDKESVKHAINGVYKAEELKQAPAMYVEGHWVRGKNEVKDFSKIKDVLKTRCHFQAANLLDVDPFLNGKCFDIIFCRNVFIYFNNDQIKKVTEVLLKHLDRDGLLFLGVSESLNGLGLSVHNAGPSVYSHPLAPQNQQSSRPAPTPIAVPKPAPILQVMCVDDSPAILALLKKILGKGSGFEVVKTAKNGLEALDYVRKNKVDIITLDLHMPEMDGLGFLSEYKEKAVPVVIVSAINRDDTSIAQKALSLGATDYVEKPSL
jgi:chemotaxis protein methyltransferase CheR